MYKMKKLVILLAIVGCSVAVNESEHMDLPKCGSEDMVHKGEFTPYDYSAVGFMLFVSLGIGIFYGYFGKSKKDVDSPSSNDFLLGSGMTVFPVTLSLTTSFITAIELLGNPSEMFFSGTQYALIVISALLVIPVAIKLFYPVYYKMNLTSCYEYLGSRFDTKIRIFGAVLYILQMAFYTSVAVLAPAIALSKATGLDTHVAVVLIYFVCIFYSSQGGMKAVVIADTFQACILALSLLLLVGFGSYYTGSPAEVFSRAQDNSRIELFNTSPDPTTRHSVFSVVIGGFFYWTSLFCTNQASVQKCMSLKSMKKAKTAISFAILGLVLVFLFNFYTGLMTYAHYMECDPLRSGQISEKDQLVPFYVMDVFGHVPFMTGIFVAGIFAASLGTVAAALNSLSAVTCEDILVTGIGMKLSPERSSLYAKWMSLGYGIISFGLVFVVERLGGILQATLTLNGLIGGVTLGLFSLGMFFRNANSKGALYGGILSLVFVIYIGIMAQIDGEPVTFLPSSMEACNCTQSSLSVSSILSDHSRGLVYDRIGDGPVTMALVAIDPSGALSTAAATVVGDKVFPAGSAASMEIMSRTSDESPLASVYRISYMWYSFLGTFLTVFFGFVISLMTGGVSFCGGKQTVDLLPTLRNSFKQDGSCNEYKQSKKDDEEGGRKSITRDDSIRIQAGAPMTMMMKTSVSSKKSTKAKGSIADEGNIFAIEGYRNQATPISPKSKSEIKMSAKGKYVRIDCGTRDDLEANGCDADAIGTSDAGRFVRAPSPYDAVSEEDYGGEGSDHQYDDYYVTIDPNRENEELRQQVADLQKTIAQLSSGTKRRQEQILTDDDIDESWNCPRNMPSSSQAAGNTTSIRWDQMKPFPKGVPANKMWEEWNKYIENFQIAASLSNADDPARRSQLLFLSMGGELQSIVRAARLKPNLNNENCYSLFIKNIEAHLRSMTDTAAEHQAFSCMQQERGESVVNFHARLMEKVRLCHYSSNDQERFVRAQLLKGMSNRELARTARTFGHETNFIVQSATRDEAYQVEEARNDNVQDTMINQVRGQSSRLPLKRPSGNGSNFGPRNKQQRFNTDFPNSRRERCSRCNRWAHWDRPCPALKLKCNSCGFTGHFAAACRRKRINAVQDSPTQQEAMPETKMEELNTLSLDDVLIDCRLGSSSIVKFLIDSGADANVIGGTDWQNLKESYEAGLAKFTPIKICMDRGLRAYATSAPMEIDFAFRAEIETVGSSNSVTADFLVVSKGKRSLLGRSTASDLKLLFVGSQVNDCEASCEEIKDEIFPKMPGVKIKFSVDGSVQPTRNAYYNIPAAYRDGARRRLVEMENSGIIERVTSAPDWISGMSAVPKGKNDFRLVVNMRAPNRAIMREYFRLPLLDEMKVKLHGAKYFTKLDLKSAYYHLELCPKSRDLTTFLSESGMFRFTRLMFGVNCAPEIFQREMTRILEQVENKIVYIDDVLLFAETLGELHETVAEVLQIFRENNLTLNRDKCEYDKTRITFLGHELDQDGFHIEEAKVSAIQKFRRPSTVSELRSFLGLASFVSPYIRNFANISNPLWTAAGKKTWNWDAEQEKAFNALKTQIIHCTVALGYFSDHERTVLYTDASPNALGAVLVQEGEDKNPRIISFASKSLTATERNYAQNQREALAAVWAVEHFSYFLLGRQFVLRTDARGITFIFDRTRENTKRALTRADGWALRLSPYRYTLEYVKGRDNIADPSSRLYQGHDEAFNEEFSPWEVASVEANAVSFLTEDEIKEFTAKDETLQQVIAALDSGSWTKNLSRYQAVSNDLHFRDGVLTKLGCAVIPDKLRRKTLEVAHSGHPLSAKLKSILRERVWWPGMTKDAEDWVGSCKTCAVTGRPEKPTPMQRVFAPRTVWETVAVDFNGPYAKYGGISILVIIDYRSRYAYARPVKSTSFEHTRKVLNEVFNKEGFPKAIKSDNGPPFNGEDYKAYCTIRGIQTIFSTPFFPQQNGLVENFMKTVNKAMCAASSGSNNYNEELQAAIQAHNAAAHTITKMPPEEVMYGRKIQRGLPLLNRGKADIDEKLLDTRDVKAKTYSKQHADARRGAKPSKVRVGDTVILERQAKAKGESRFNSKRHTVVRDTNGSLILRNEDGLLVRRHITQTRKVEKWRNSGSEATARTTGNTEHSMEPALTTHPSRERRAPKHLDNYVRNVEGL